MFAECKQRQKIWLQFFLHESVCLKYNLHPGSFRSFERLKETGDQEIYHWKAYDISDQNLSFAHLWLQPLERRAFLLNNCKHMPNNKCVKTYEKWIYISYIIGSFRAMQSSRSKYMYTTDYIFEFVPGF